MPPARAAGRRPRRSRRGYHHAAPQRAMADQGRTDPVAGCQPDQGQRQDRDGGQSGHYPGGFHPAGEAPGRRPSPRPVRPQQSPCRRPRRARLGPASLPLPTPAGSPPPRSTRWWTPGWWPTARSCASTTPRANTARSARSTTAPTTSPRRFPRWSSATKITAASSACSMTARTCGWSSTLSTTSTRRARPPTTWWPKSPAPTRPTKS